MTETLLEVNDLNVAFRLASANLTVSSDVSFSVDRGKVLGLIGESGSGKTVTSKAILRLLPKNASLEAKAIRFKGRDISTLTEAEFNRLRGTELDAAVPHRVFSGNRPSNTLLMPRVDPFHLGALLALYEHRTFVQSVIWNINAFDQWGVELGKQLAKSVVSALDGEVAELDPSTRALVARISDGVRFQR